METPLVMLQKFVVSNKKVSIKDGRINFGDEFSWPENVKTNYLAYGSGKNGSSKKYYSLKSLVFFLHNVNCQHVLYVREAVRANISVVRRPDRKNLLAYLNGDIATCESIDKLAQPESRAPSTKLVVQAGVKRPVDAPAVDEASQETARKKARLADAEKLKARFVTKLSSTKENCAMTGDLKSLSEVMTDEQNAAIKIKRLVKKRTTIKTHNGLGGDMQTMPSVIFDTNDGTKDVISRERDIRNRKTSLQSRCKEFATNVLAVIQSVEEREMSKRREYQPHAPTFTLSQSSRKAAVGYNRYKQERYTKPEKTTDGLTIQTTDSYFLDSYV